MYQSMKFFIFTNANTYLQQNNIFLCPCVNERVTISFIKHSVLDEVQIRRYSSIDRRIYPLVATKTTETYNTDNRVSLNKRATFVILS